MSDSELNLTEGGNLHIEVKVDPFNDSSMHIEWYHNETELKVSNRITTFHGFGFAILEINNFSDEDAGVYVCLAKNDKGYSQQNFNVNIIKSEPQEKPKFQQPLENDIKVAEGQSIHVETTVIPNDIQLEWFHNGKPLQKSSRIKTTSDFGYVVLEISPVEPRDSGEYLLMATNKHGIDTCKFNLECAPSSNIDTSTMFELPAEPTVIRPAQQKVSPKFKRKLPDQINVIEGQSIHLENNYTPFDGSVQIEWLRDGKPLIASERFQTINEFGFAILDIVYCYEDDSGVYEIVATNPYGSDSIKTTIVCQGIFIF